MNTFDQALRTVCDSLTAPCAVFDPASDALLLANPAFRREFGALPNSRAEFEQLFEPLAAGPAAAGIVSPLEDIPEAQRLEVFCPRSSRWYAFQWSVLRNHQDTPLTLLSAQNLTECMETSRQQRALQEQLLSSSRAMSVGEMTTTLAHEINQPLATIVNCLSAARTMLARGGESPQPLRQALDLALEQAGAVIARIREFVRTQPPRAPGSGVTESDPRLSVLTRRERQVIELVVAGKFNKSIADILGISTKTVELHRASLMAKLGVRNLPDLVKVYLGYR